jgi:hypothetical protein
VVKAISKTYSNSENMKKKEFPVKRREISLLGREVANQSHSTQAQQAQSW